MMPFIGETLNPGSSRTEVRSPTRTEVRSPTRTATEVRSPTSTSTEAYTQGNMTTTVTGGAGAGGTTVHIHAPPLNRVNSASSKGPRKNAQENENINAPRPDERNSSGLSGMTPAQASGHPDFITDVPVQGPTDEGLRAADCWWTQNRLPAQPACADCEGPIPMWAKQSLSIDARGPSSGIGERVSFGGVGALGFALEAAGDPEVWTKITPAQQTWVVQTLVKLDENIRKATNTTCATFGPSITAAGGCFQRWFNAQNLGLTKPNGDKVVLRTDGEFDQETLDALRTVVALHAADFPTPFPGTSLPGLTGTGEKKLSTGAMVGIGAGVVALGGIAYVATRKKSRRRR